MLLSTRSRYLHRCFSTNMEPEVLFEQAKSARIIQLNRPKALNALNLNMIRLMVPKLRAYQESETCKVVILKGNGRAFCAGGDVKAVVQAAEKDPAGAFAFFREEYQLDHLLATLKKPVVALLNGITMGGGVGISIHTPFRIATENTVFAMPETAIGLFPDVGGSFFLPRLDGNIGKYLALTGDRLKAQETVWTGIATHYVPSERLPLLEKRICDLDTSDYSIINNAIEEFSENLSPSNFKFANGPTRTTIETCFAHETVEAILEALGQDGSEFALKTKKTLLTVSPTSLKVTLQQLKRGATLDISGCFNLESKMASHALEALNTNGKSKDFAEGVRALLVDRTNDPKWSPESLEKVTKAQVDWYFRDIAEPWQPINSETYSDYPYNFGLPTEHEIQQQFISITRQGKTQVSRESFLERFKQVASNRSSSLKSGVVEKVADVLDRHCEVSPVSKYLKWVGETSRSKI